MTRLSGAGTDDSLELFRSAVRSCVERGDFASRLALESLRASILMQDSPESYEKVYLEETAPDQVQLDLHLEDGSVHDHETSALALTQFVSNLAQAVKSMAQSIGNIRSADDILIQGVTPGSVRVVLRAPDLKRPTGETLREGAERTIPEVSDVSPQSQALREVARLFSQASSDTQELELEMVQPVSARRKLAAALRTTETQGWNLSGQVLQRHVAPQRLRLTGSGAAHLRVALNQVPDEVSTITLSGQIDGHKHSDGRIYFIPDSGAPFSLFAPYGPLHTEAARLSSDPENRVIVTFQQRTARGPDGSPGRGVERILQKLEPKPRADAHPPALFD